MHHKEMEENKQDGIGNGFSNLSKSVLPFYNK